MDDLQVQYRPSSGAKHAPEIQEKGQDQVNDQWRPYGNEATIYKKQSYFTRWYAQKFAEISAHAKYLKLNEISQKTYHARLGHSSMNPGFS